MERRNFSHNAMALGYALKCDYDDLKKVALRRVRRAIENNSGATTKIAAELEVSTSVYQAWVNMIPEVRELHYKERPEVMIGRKPRALMTPQERRSAARQKG